MPRKPDVPSTAMRATISQMKWHRFLIVFGLLAIGVWHAKNRPRPRSAPPTTAFCDGWVQMPEGEQWKAVVIGLEAEVLDQDCVAMRADRLARVVTRSCSTGLRSEDLATARLHEAARELCP